MRKYVLFFLVLLMIPVALAKTGHMKLLAVAEVGDEQIGSTADVYLEVKSGTGRIYIDTFPLTKVDTQISTRFANEIACDFLNKNCQKYDFFYTIRADTPIVGGPSASAAIAVLTVVVMDNLDFDDKSTITGTINSGGIIGPVGGIVAKLEAAEKHNLTKVLIPKWSKINETNLTEFEDKITVVQVSNLNDAVYELTGKRYEQRNNLIISSAYLETMKNISYTICGRTNYLAPEVNASDLNEAFDLYEEGNISLQTGKYYSAASYCFGANVRFNYFKLRNELVSEATVQNRISFMKNQTDYLEANLKQKQVKTLVDLQSYVVVNERLMDAREYLQLAQDNINDTNTSLYNLAYGIERLNSALLWSKFFDIPGKPYKINKVTLAKSCLNKISEAEERMQYAKLYLPLLPETISKDINYAYKYYNEEYYDLCLHTASKAKADINLILDTLSLDEDQIPALIDERLRIAEDMIAKQDEKGAFPIIGYSYYEYAKSLRENDKFSALLYLEYAFELSNLDIYFERETFEFPEIRIGYIVIFTSGLTFGFVLGFIWLKQKFIKV